MVLTKSDQVKIHFVKDLPDVLLTVQSIDIIMIMENDIGIILLNRLYDLGIDKTTAKGLLTFSKTANNWKIIYKEIEGKDSIDVNSLQLFALALGEVV